MSVSVTIRATTVGLTTIDKIAMAGEYQVQWIPTAR